MQVLLILMILGLVGLMLASMWKIYEKAGREGWEALVPFYNVYVLLEIVKKPWWWLLLMMIPYVGAIWAVWSYNLLAKKFGKTEVFTVGLILLPFIFFPILAFGDARFEDAPAKEDDPEFLDSNLV